MPQPPRIDPDEILKQIGVVDLEDGESYVASNPGRQNNSGLMVRGISKGGSPVLNILTWVVSALALALIGGVLYGGYYLLTSNGSGEIVAGPGAPQGIECKKGLFQRSPVAKSVGEAASVVLGQSSFPREPEVLAEIGASTHSIEGDRVDVFQPEGAQLAVRYEGAGPNVWSVSTRFTEPVHLCRALLAVGVLTESFRVQPNSQGFLQPVGDEVPAYFLNGGQVFVQGPIEAVELIQLQR